MERYSHVMHIVSSKACCLRDGCRARRVSRHVSGRHALGAPKVRAMEIIDELEPVQRGIYGGACGYLSFAGDMDLAIAIRTGIVKDTLYTCRRPPAWWPTRCPQAEWNETHRQQAVRALPSRPRKLSTPASRRGAMILMIDNYDSFTFNLVQYFGELGADVRVVPNDADRREDRRKLAPASGSSSRRPCSPAEAGISLADPAAIRRQRCPPGVPWPPEPSASRAGRQGRYAKELMHGKASPVDHTGRASSPACRIAGIVIRYHSLAVERESLPELEKLTAWTTTARSWACATRASTSKACSSTPNPSSEHEHDHAMLKNFLRCKGAPDNTRHHPTRKPQCNAPSSTARSSTTRCWPDAPHHERRDVAGDDRRHHHRPARQRRRPSARSPPPRR